MAVLLLASILVALGVGIWHLLRAGLPRREKRLYEILRQQSGGDTDLAERLIEYELRRSPDLSRGKAIETAIWRLDRDRS